MFQIVNRHEAAEYLRASRKWVLVRGIVPLYIFLAPLEFALLEPAEASYNLVYGFAVAIVLLELFFFNFNKVPFTCSYLPAKSHLAFLAGAYLYGFTIYTFTMASLERWVSATQRRTLAFFLLTVTALAGISLYRRYVHDCTLELVYEDDRDPLVRQLNLS
jgi:hypothetical protein